jgi:8-oxo-dGTP diphosphatase
MAVKGTYIYDWPRPMVTVDAVVFRRFEGKTQLLLIKRGNEPFVGKWAFPGGFVDMDEELEDAVLRELKEETGLTGVALEQMHTFGKVGRDPRGRQITIAFMGIADSLHSQVKGGDDAAEARWFDIDNLLGRMDLAFDHDNVAKIAIKRLRERI